MSNYYRITAYHPERNLSVIMDSNGAYEKLWQFSSFLIQKGLKVIEVSSGDKFLDVNIDKAEPDAEHILLRAYAKGKPVRYTDTLDEKSYPAIMVGGKIYIPDRDKRV